MDELWQRYRTFWTPVLIGLGVFLIGVIAVLGTLAGILGHALIRIVSSFRGQHS